ncbi:MAG: Sir2 family NAD-dependent protein deacetylase [Muribaculaceae bacterium]|nr:NAD-dependent deacylase [Bacteroidales bacterium]MDY4811349.1 Sir2 family NAD-dependent protein deacetylase [Muribaculaceae bacterium]
MKKKLVISTGAGISAESGISTFRDAGGLWENYNVMDVASADGFARNPALIHQFYNARRKELVNAKPNAAHTGLVDLEKDFDVYVITQNVDNLHERAGSKNVLHLHGELMKVRALDDETKVYELHPGEANFETSPDTIIDGHHVRPHIVFFQEAVPNIEPAVQLVQEADIFVVIGTSLAVYPAAGLLNYVRPGTPVYYIDPHPAAVPAGVTVIPLPATAGVDRLSRLLRNK